MQVVEKRMEKRRIRVRELYAKDLQITVIADILNVSQPTIYKDLIVMGLRKRGEYSLEQRDAISRGIRKKNAREYLDRKTKTVCCVCGLPAERGRYRNERYCLIHLITAGDHDPEYENNERAAAGDRFASHGRDM